MHNYIHKLIHQMLIEGKKWTGITWQMVVFKVRGFINILAVLYFFNTFLRLQDASSNIKKIIGVVPGIMELMCTPCSLVKLSWWSLERIETSWRTSWYDCGIRWSAALAVFNTCSREHRCWGLLSVWGSNTLIATGILSFSYK